MEKEINDSKDTENKEVKDLNMEQSKNTDTKQGEEKQTDAGENQTDTGEIPAEEVTEGGRKTLLFDDEDSFVYAINRNAGNYSEFSEGANSRAFKKFFLRSSGAPKNYFSPFDSGIGLILLIALQSVLSVVYLGLMIIVSMLTATEAVRGFLITFLLYIATDAIFFLAVFLSAKASKTNLIKALKLDKKPTVKEALFAVLIALVCLFTFLQLTNSFVNVLYNFGFSSVAEDVKINNFLSYIYSVVVLCVLPAVFEEIMFRGLVQGSLEKINKHFAVWISAFIFMIMHTNPDQTFYQFVLGVFLSYSFYYTRTLWVPIIIHFVNNFTIVTISFIVAVSGEASEAAEILTFEEIAKTLPFALVLASIGGVIFYFICNKLKEDKIKQLGVNTFADVIKEEDRQNNMEGDLSLKGVTKVTDGIVIGEEHITVDGEKLTQTETANTQSSDTGFIKPGKKLFASGEFIMYCIAIGYMAYNWVSILIRGLLNN